MPTGEELRVVAEAIVVQVRTAEQKAAVHYVVDKPGTGRIWLYPPLAPAPSRVIHGVPAAALSVLATLKAAGREFDLQYHPDALGWHFDLLNAMGG